MLKEENISLGSPVSGVSGDVTHEGKRPPNTGDTPPSPVSPVSVVDDLLGNLTPAQRAVAEAIVDFARGKTADALACLAGYAGVGKTTVVAAVVRALARWHIYTGVLAPTHKALSVLSDKLGGADVETSTIQSALALRVKERPDGQQDLEDTGDPGALRSFQFAIVDEASMVGPALFATLLFKRGACRVLFVGDPAQLAPIDRDPERKPGEETLSPVFGGAVPRHWKLTEVVRQAQDNPIIRLATAARECIAVGADFGLQAMTRQLQPADDRFLAIQPGGVAEISALVADAIAHGQDTRALAFDNASVQAINANVHAMVFPGRGPYPDGTLLMAQEGFNGWLPSSLGTPKWEKAPVRNSALLTVRGCEERAHPAEKTRAAWLLTLEDEAGARLACWTPADARQWQADISECFADYRRLKMREQMAQGSERRALHDQASAASQQGWALKARYAPLRYAYAMTVHKAQGSTFDAVVLDWGSFQRTRDVQLRNRLAYVALTRTRKFAVVCA